MTITNILGAVVWSVLDGVTGREQIEWFQDRYNLFHNLSWDSAVSLQGDGKGEGGVEMEESKEVK